MKLQDWAKKEIELLFEKGAENDCCGYSRACYESALKAFCSLCDDGHSGMSIQITHRILDRLINCKCLSPIEDTDDVWGSADRHNPNEITYQCKRMTSLFKTVYADGTVKYSDVDRYMCMTPESKYPFRSSLISNLIDKMYPITMPYFPSTQPMCVHCEEFLFDEKNGDFDTIGIYYMNKDNEMIEINRYFKETEDGFVEIQKEEYEQRKANKKGRQ